MCAFKFKLIDIIDDIMAAMATMSGMMMLMTQIPVPNISNNKILNSKANVQNCKVDRTDKIEESTERLTERCHTPDLLKAFLDENGGLNQSLQKYHTYLVNLAETQTELLSPDYLFISIML